MKSLLLVIVLVWAQCGNAASPYTLNELRMSPKEGGASHLLFVREHRGEDDTIAIRMHNNNIDSKRYEGPFIPVVDADEDVFGMVTGEAFVTVDGTRRALVSFSTHKPTLRGSKFEFNSAVFCGVQSIIFEAPEESTSMLRKVSLHRSSKGKIALDGVLDFTKIFECMQNLGDGGLAAGIGQPALARHFLISGAESAGFSVQVPVSRSPGKGVSHSAVTAATGGTPKSKSGRRKK
ncbi:MAG: hypothetical protein K2Q34_06015 [Alphaproteobacteria bacterium]|nr:hypothetical protein [Alphaproteobacteria bacterium]